MCCLVAHRKHRRRLTVECILPGHKGKDGKLVEEVRYKEDIERDITSNSVAHKIVREKDVAPDAIATHAKRLLGDVLKRPAAANKNHLQPQTATTMIPLVRL